MKNIIEHRFIILLVVAFLSSCSSEEDLIEDWIETSIEETEPPVTGSAGDLDLSKYVAVGNSLTAGFADAALSPAGQASSFATLLAGQLAIAGGGDFVNPDISSGNGFGGLNGQTPVGRSFIDLQAAVAALDGTGSFADVIQFTEGILLTESGNKGAALNNFGVPGARVIDLSLAGYGDATFGNPFFASFATSGTTTILADAVSAEGTFITLWIGSNDVLGYASDGGNDTPNATGSNVITPTADFQTALTTVLTTLTANDAQVALLNIPPITVLPFFQTVTVLSGGVNLIPLTDQGQVDALNAAYAGYNGGLDLVALGTPALQEEVNLRKISFQLGANPPVITDESLTDLSGSGLPSIRQARVDATSGQSDLFPLTALASIGQVVTADSILGVTDPLADDLTLTIEEQVTVITAYATFNGVIEALAAANPNVTLVDVRPLFADMFGLTAAQATGLVLGDAAVAAADGVEGLVSDGFNYLPLSLSTETIYNSVWSTDGIHPNARGSALIANEIISVLNEQFSASIPLINPLDLAPINAPL